MKLTRLEKYLICVYKICCASGMSREVLIPRAHKAGVLSLYQVGPHYTKGMVMEGFWKDVLGTRWLDNLKGSFS